MDYFLGEIRMFAGTLSPAGWAFCDGRTLQISEYNALYALLGTSFGGNGTTTFGLPDMQGRTPIHVGQNSVGAKTGTETVALTQGQIPSHTHNVMVSNDQGNNSSASGMVWANKMKQYQTAPLTSPAVMHADCLKTTGNSVDHENMMPFTTINYIIALNGVWPPHD